MRVAIATFHRAVNVGAYLQQHALSKTLEGLGFDVDILRYASPFARNELRSRFHRYHGAKRITSLWQAVRFWRMTKDDFHFSPRVASAASFDWSRYDAVVFGSDEIWNVSNWFSGYCPLLFGRGIRGVRKVSYAPSFGEISDKAQLPAEVAQLLQEFHSLSVRDHNSAALVKSLTGREAHLSLDPTLIYDFSAELQRFPANHHGALVVYATQIEPTDRDRILRYAAANQLKVIALGFPHAWADSTLSQAHPLQIISEFRSAGLIFTNTFHGTALAAKFDRPFALGTLSGKHNKVSSLLKHLQLCPRQLENTGAGDKTPNEMPLNASPTGLIREIESSLSYLHSALSGLD
jgi:Polysaccharide pyruvyl transferase